MYCEICKNEFKDKQHITRFHKISLKDYYDKYLKREDEGICLCCGKETTFYNLKRGYRKCCSQSCGAKIGQTNRYKNPEERLKTANSIRERMKRQDIRQKLSIKQKERFSNPENVKLLSESMKNSKKFQDIVHSEEYRLNMSKIVTERYKHKENRDKMSESCKNSIKVKESHKTKQFKEKHSEIMRDRIKNGELMVRYNYNGVSFMSLPEFAYYKFLEDNNLQFEYQCEPIIYEVNGVEKKYIPDFKVEGTYVEIKGPHLIKDGHLWNPFDKCFMPEKERCIIENHVVILTKNDYTQYVDWFIEKYGTDFISKFKKRAD